MMRITVQVKVIWHVAGMVLFLNIASGYAMGARTPDLLTVSGTIRVVGNEPFSRLVLTTERTDRVAGTRDFLIIGSLQEELRNRHQGRRVTLLGKSCTADVPGFSSCLDIVRILKIDE